jgi:hypothetical protein
MHEKTRKVLFIPEYCAKVVAQYSGIDFRVISRVSRENILVATPLA